MLRHHPLAQTLPTRLALVVGAGLLLQCLFCWHADRPGPLAGDALPSPRTSLTGGGGERELPPPPFSRRVIIVRGLSRRAAHFLLLQVDHKLALGETIAVVTRRHLGRPGAFSLGEGAAGRPSPLGAIPHRFLHLRTRHPLALLHPLQRLLLVPRIPRQHLNSEDQWALDLHRHRRLVPVEALARTLAPLPHLGIVYTHHPVLGGPLLDLAFPARLLLHLLGHQPLQPCGLGFDPFLVLRVLLLDLLRQAQYPSPVPDHLRQQLLALRLVIPIDRRFPLHTAAPIAAQLVPARPGRDLLPFPFRPSFRQLHHSFR